MNLSCEVVMDLLPLYIDGLASEDSAELVKEHLRICPNCRKYYRNCRKIAAPDSSATEETPVEIDGEKFHELSARMKKRHILSTSALLGIVTLSVTGTLLSILMTSKKNKTGE